MLEKVEFWIGTYCFAVLEIFFQALTRLHPAASMGVPLLITVGVQWFLPRSVWTALVALVWLPAAIAFTVLIWSCWTHTRLRRDS